MAKYVIQASTLFIFWLLLVDRLTLQEIVVGLIVSLCLVLFFKPAMNWVDDVKWSARLPYFFGQYLAVFMLAVIKANLDMAWRVLHPSLPIDPVEVIVETRLKSKMGRFLLANSITLTPGTLTLDVVDQQLKIHWIDGSLARTEEDIKKRILLPFEQQIGKFLK